MDRVTAARRRDGHDVREESGPGHRALGEPQPEGRRGHGQLRNPRAPSGLQRRPLRTALRDHQALAEPRLGHKRMLRRREAPR